MMSWVHFQTFALSEYTFVIMGWIPKKKLQKVKKIHSRCISGPGCRKRTGHHGKRYGRCAGLL